MQFVSDEKHRMIQLAENLLVVNQLQPYPHFEEWESEVQGALQIYTELTRPTKIARLGVRYINRVVIPAPGVRMEDCFTIYPNLPSGLGDRHGSFLVRVEVPLFEQDRTVLITFGTAPPEDPKREEQAFMLDLYDILQLDKPLDEVDLEREIERGHDNIVVAFEDSITDRLRDLFEPENHEPLATLRERYFEDAYASPEARRTGRGVRQLLRVGWESGLPTSMTEASANLWRDVLAERFQRLATSWRRECAHLSSIPVVALNPDCQQIVGMGPSALPFILAELERQPDHWFWALRAITQEDPVPPEHRGNVGQMTHDWLRWAKRNGIR